MLRQFSHQHPEMIQILLIIGIGLVLGVAILGSSSSMLLAGLAGGFFILAVLLWPEIALLGLLFLSSTVIDIYALPSISIGIGHLILYDVVVFIPLVVIVIKALVTSRFNLFSTPLNLPLIGFYGTAMISTAIAIYQNSVSFNQSLGEIRVVNGYLTFFIVTNLIRDEKRLRRLIKGIILLSIMVAIAMAVQYILGSSIPILAGRVEVEGTAGVEGITRILPPGQSLVMIGFITTIVLMLIDRTKPLSLGKLLQAFILGFAILITFNRNFWVAIGLSLLLMGSLIPLANKVRLVMIVFIALLMVIAVVPEFTSSDSHFGKLISAATTRFSTLFYKSSLNDSSLQYRLVENSYAFPEIASHPFLGLGLGNNYRPWDDRIDYGIYSIEKRNYIHNGYLWVMLKTGLVGFIFLMWLILLFLKRGFLKWRHISDPFFRVVVLSFTVTIVGLLVASLVNPIFDTFYWAPVIGVMLATNELIYKIDEGSSQASIVVET